MATGDTKTFDFYYNGLTLQVIAVDAGNGKTDFQIKCISGSADVNALWWGDKIADGSAPTLSKSDNSLNMNGTGVDWDGYAKLSSTGLGSLGWAKATALTAGETYNANDVAVSWDSIETLGVRATSTSTAEGSVKGIDSEGTVQKLPTISIGNAEVSEGDTAQFTVTLSNTYPYPITVNYHTAPGTAADGSDYSGVSGTVTIPAGQTTATIFVATTENGIYELTENFTVELTGAKADLPDALGDIPLSPSSVSGVGTITDDELQPTVAISDGNPASQDEDGGAITFTVSLTGPADKDVTVTYSTVNGSAVAGEDFTGASHSTVVILAGQTSATITVPVLNDEVFELDEAFTVQVESAVYDAGGANVGFAVADNTGTGNIVDNDPKPSFAIDDVTVNEADGTITFTVTKTGATAVTATVDYAIAPGTAGTPGDYSGALSGTLTFLAGETTQTITLDVTNDGTFEQTEQFSVNLSGETYATISDSEGVGTITDDEAQPTVAISDGNPNPQTEGAGATITFTVSLSGPADKDVTVTYSTVNGSATAGADFTGVTDGTVVIAAGQTSAEIVIAVTNDSVFELGEAFTVAVSSAVYDAGGADVAFTVTDDSGTGNITNDDPPPSFSINDATVNEADGTITFTVTKAGATDVTATVDYAVAPGTAGTPGDYTGTLSGTLTFLAGQTTQTITLNITNDGTFEQTELFSVNLSGATNATISDSQGVGTISDNDTPPPAGPVFGPTLTGTALPSIENGADPNDHDADSATATSSAGTNGDDILVGTSGGNTLTGANGNDDIYGGGGNDTISGGNHNDDLYGQPGSDTINGDQGSDVIYGGSGNDTIDGDGQNDLIYGGSGNDIIFGDGQNDTIVGGYGADTLSGDGDADVFKYLNVLDTNDIINGFSSAQGDKIDLSAIDAIGVAPDNAFAWAGQTPTNTAQVAANSVSWYTTGGNVIVLADTDGITSTAEFQITLTGITTIAQTDFIL